MLLQIRAAQAYEAPQLSELALKSKAYWPYDDGFIQDCIDELTITPERAGGGFLFVAELEKKIVGFYGFDEDINSPEMTHLFVDPDCIGKGVGKALWRDALTWARSQNWSSFQIVADPYAAEKFYIPMGCQKIGTYPSSVRPGRELPLLEFKLVK